MKKEIFLLIFYINNPLLILFYTACADMLLAPLWGLTYLVFFVVSAATLLNAVSMKRINRSFVGKCSLYGILTIGILAIVFSAMVLPLKLAMRIPACTITVILSVFHAKIAAALGSADEKYIRKTDELTREDLAEYMMAVIKKEPYARHDKRTKITVLNIITALLSVLLLLLGNSSFRFFLFDLFNVVLVCVSLAFIYFSRKKYHAAELKKRKFLDIPMAFLSVLLLLVQPKYSVNFLLTIASVLLMCPYWMTTYDLLCRFQLGWELAD